MATCQSLLLLKVASFGTFYEVALPGFVAVTEVMSQEWEQEWGALIQWSLAAEQQFKLRMLTGSFLLQTYSFQAMHSYQKKNTMENMFDLFALLILTCCSCLAFCLQSPARYFVYKYQQNSSASHEGYLGTEPTNERLGSRLFDSSSQREGPFLGGNGLRISEAPSVSLQAVPTSAVHFCQAGMKWDARVRESSKQQSLLAPTQLELGKRCLFRLSHVAFSVSFPISLWGRVEAVEQQGRRKGDSDCLFHVGGQFCSVPLQLEEHLSTLTSANRSSAAPGEAHLTEVPLFSQADTRESTIISKISIWVKK